MKRGSFVWAATVLICVVAAIGLGLAFAGWQDQAVIGWTVGMGAFAGGVLTLLVRVDQKTDQQTVALHQIEDRVNGGMQASIADAVEAGIARATERYRAEQQRAIEAGPEARS